MPPILGIFLYTKDEIYWFASKLQKELSNFLQQCKSHNSSELVPIFFSNVKNGFVSPSKAIPYLSERSNYKVSFNILNQKQFAWVQGHCKRLSNLEKRQIKSSICFPLPSICFTMLTCYLFCFPIADSAAVAGIGCNWGGKGEVPQITQTLNTGSPPT